METTGITRALRVVRSDETGSRDRDPGGDAGCEPRLGAGALSTEDYWARVQALRADPGYREIRARRASR